MRVLGILASLALVVFLALDIFLPGEGRGAVAEASHEPSSVPLNRVGGDRYGPFARLVDPETGCEYLVNGRGVSPRYGRDGEVIGCGEGRAR